MRNMQRGLQSGPLGSLARSMCSEVSSWRPEQHPCIAPSVCPVCLYDTSPCLRTCSICRKGGPMLELPLVPSHGSRYGFEHA